jgi:hypothetical protein
MEMSIIVGWVFLISSWVVPYFIKDEAKKRFTGTTLSSIALGIFIGHLLTKVGQIT